MLCENGVKRGVLGDAFEGDVRDAFVDESARNACRFVFKFVVVEVSCQKTLTRQGNRHAAGVNGYPASAPVFCDISGGAATAGGIEDKIAGVCGH